MPPDTEIRDAARQLVTIAAQKHSAAERALGYFLCSALAHGVTVSEIEDDTGLDRDTVLRLTDPMVAS